MMTREELVLQRLNTLEQRVKKAVLSGDKTLTAIAIKEQNGYMDALTDLGYRAIEDEDKAEYLAEEGYWIYTYKAIKDVR